MGKSKICFISIKSTKRVTYVTVKGRNIKLIRNLYLLYQGNKNLSKF